VGIGRVACIGNHVTVVLERGNMPKYAAERAIRRGIVEHTPGARRRGG
jgi:hypothetical protein